ncbi:MAG: hypothetical protein LBR25_10210 [Erysipelotrichaceae bacterium]|jgi:predicted transcriptional regulator|nr:hypothetical protein [Erysipelotrichaceae bacterium]
MVVRELVQPEATQIEIEKGIAKSRCIVQEAMSNLQKKELLERDRAKRNGK